MPRKVDRQQRDDLVVHAAWRVLTRDGLSALSVRNVAAEAGLPPSSLRYTFPTQASVRERAVQAVIDRARDRVDHLPPQPEGAVWARAVLLELLPLDEERRTEMEVAVSLGTAAMTDPALDPAHHVLNRAMRDIFLRVATALGRPNVVDELHALVDGLALHLLHRLHGEDTDWAIHVLDRYVHTIATDGRRNAEGARLE